MEAKLQKWGNSDGIRIPKNLLKSLNLKTNDLVELVQENEKLIITKAKKNHLTFEERISLYEKLPQEEKGNIENYDWGTDLGKERYL